MALFIARASFRIKVTPLYFPEARRRLPRPVTSHVRAAVTWWWSCFLSDVGVMLDCADVTAVQMAVCVVWGGCFVYLFVGIGWNSFVCPLFSFHRYPSAVDIRCNHLFTYLSVNNANFFCTRDYFKTFFLSYFLTTSQYTHTFRLSSEARVASKLSCGSHVFRNNTHFRAPRLASHRSDSVS